MITAIGDVMRQCYENGWITTRDGNCSLRRKDSNYLYITPSGVRKNKIEVESILKLKIVDRELIVPEDIKPSGELHMHWLLQKHSNKTRVVLHVHPTYIIAAIHAGFKLDELAKEFPEVSRYTRVGPNVHKLPAISKELADATYLAMCPTDNIEYDIVGQANHGVCVVAGDPWSAYEHVERLEHICQIVLASGVKP
jgi:L-fuculose-phosphate aldolase